MKRTFFLLWICVIATLLSACHSKSNDEPVATTTLELPDFSADSAYAFVKTQTDFGPRVPNSQAHADCADYLKNKLAQYADTVSLQTFDVKAYDGKTLHACNIMGSFAPEKEKRILLASHWDSRHIADHDPIERFQSQPIDGANDGASGVGVLLEVARQLQIKNPNIGVDIVFFDVEDYGTPSSVDIDGDWWALGSQYWAKQAYANGYRAEYGILLDMVGAADATFYHEYFSDSYAPDIVSKVWSTAYKLGHGKYFINESSHPITDDHLYVNRLGHLKMIDIIHQDKNSATGFPAVWHTHDDDIQHIAPNTLAVVGTTLLAVIYAE